MIMYRKEIEQKKIALKLTKRQREILVGLMLGDGHLETQNNGRTYRLKIEQSIKHKEYVDWLFQEFNEWVMTHPQEKNQQDKKRGKEYHKYWFNTLSAGSLRFYAHQFYDGKKKIVPKQIAKWLTPLSMAIWYMDDGSIKSQDHSTVLFNTQGFTKVEVQRLKEALETKFRIMSRLHKQKDGWQLYLLSETIPKFRSVVEDLILPSMKYKLPKVWLTKLPKQ